MFLIAGLGNPGTKYRYTRHNMGFRVIGRWMGILGLKLSSRRFHARCGLVSIGRETVVLLCPVTFMNRSGIAVRACMDYYRLEPHRVLVVHDDIDLPVGRVRVVRQGGGGGHKGIQSVMDHLGTRAFARVKIGVGRPRRQEPVEEFVLSPFYDDEEDIVERVVPVAIRACEVFVSEGVEEAMHEVNWQNLAQKEGKD